MRAAPLLIVAVVGASGCLRLGFDDSRVAGLETGPDATADLITDAPVTDGPVVDTPQRDTGRADQGLDSTRDADSSGKLPLGASCQADDACITGFCVEAVCCGSACTGVCKACSATWTGSVSGACAFVVSSKDPRLDCLADQACDGAGACKKVNGTACSLSGECVSAACVESVCCDGACTGTCRSCLGLKTGSVVGSCGYIKANTDPDNECSSTDACDGAGTCRLRDGQPCAGKTQCASGNCPADDGVCCNSGCGSLCKACVGSKTAALDGVCAEVLTGTDPDTECAGALTCDGSGGCL